MISFWLFVGCDEAPQDERGKDLKKFEYNFLLGLL